MSKFVLNSKDDNPERVYQVKCYTTQYLTGDKEIVVEIDGNTMISIVTDDTSEVDTIHVFERAAKEVGFKIKVQGII